MLDLSDRRAIEEWLKDKPKELRVVIAARAALRVVPALLSVLDRGDVKWSSENIILPAFRAMTSPWVEARHGSDNMEIRAAAAAGAAGAGQADSESFLRLSESETLMDAASAVLSAAAQVSYVASDPDDLGAAVDAIFYAGDALREFARAATASLRGLFTTPGAVSAAVATIDDAAARAILDDEIIAQQGLSPRELAERPLWQASPPHLLSEAWTKLTEELHSADEGWDVWTSWYGDRLAGRPSDATLELARATIPDDVWTQEASVVNAYIANLQKDHQLKGSLGSDSRDSTIPSLERASVEPVWVNGQLTLPKGPIRSDLDEAAFVGALLGLQAELSQFADELVGEANIDGRFISFVRRVAARIPEGPPSQKELFLLGHDHEVFEGYTETVAEQWPAFLTSRYRALCEHFGRTIRQCESWREFRKNAELQAFDRDDLSLAASLAAEMVISLRDDDAQEFVDPLLTDAIEKLSAPLVAVQSDPDKFEASAPASRNALLASDVIDSLNNVLKQVAHAVLIAGARSKSKLEKAGSEFIKAANEYAAGFSRGFIMAASEQGPKDGAKVFKWLRRATVGTTLTSGFAYVLHRAIATFPDAFAWMQKLVQWLI